MAMTPQACRAARALLNWSMRDLAAHSGLSLGAVTRLEDTETNPRRSTTEAARAAFLAHGVQIVDEPTYIGAVMVYGKTPSGAA